MKTITYKKNNINYDLRTTNVVEVSQDVEIFRGYDDNTIITYREKGNDAPGTTSSDLIVHIKEVPHKSFKRINKNDLLYIHEIPLVKALNSEPVCLNTLDGRKLAISIDEIISPSTLKVIPGKECLFMIKIYLKLEVIKFKKEIFILNLILYFQNILILIKRKELLHSYVQKKNKFYIFNMI